MIFLVCQQRNDVFVSAYLWVFFPKVILFSLSFLHWTFSTFLCWKYQPQVSELRQEVPSPHKTTWKKEDMMVILHQLDLDHRCPDWAFFLGESVKVFPEEMSIWTGGQSKAVCPPCVWAPSRPEWNKTLEEEISSLPDWRAESSCPGTGASTMSLLVLRPLDSDGNLHPWLSWVPWWLLGFYNPISQCLVTHLIMYVLQDIFYWFCFSGEPWLIQKTSAPL